MRTARLAAAGARFRLLNLRQLTAAKLRATVTLASVVLSVALVTGLFSTYGSLVSSVRQLSNDLAGDASLEVSGFTDGGFAEDLLPRVSATPGVALAVPMVRGVVTIDGHRVVLIGVDQRVTSLRSSLQDTLDSLPSATRLSIYSVTREDRNELVIGPGLARAAGFAPGQDVPVTGALGKTTSAVLFSTVDVAEARALNQGYWAIANLRAAQRLTGRGARLDSILVVADPGADVTRLGDRLRDNLAHQAVVATPQFRAAQASDAASLLRNMSLFVASIALAVAGLLTFNTFAMAAVERRPELATVRALGGRRRTAHRDLLAEAVLLGLAGGLLGLPLGIALGRVAVASLPPLLTESFEARVQFSFAWQVGALAVCAAVATAVLGAWSAARQVLRITPLDALRHNDAPAGRPVRRITVPVLLGVAALGASALSLVVFADQRALVGGPLLLCGVLALTYAAAGPLTRAVAWLVARTGASGVLATVAVARVPRRVWATSMTLAVACAIGVASYGAVHNVAAVASAPSLAWTDFYVKGTPPDVLPTGPVLPADLTRKVAAVPGVAEVIPCQAAYATIGRRRVILAGVSGGNAPAFRRASESARRQVLLGTGVVLSRGLARSLHLDVHDTLVLPTSVGERRLPVVDVVDFLSLDAGMVVLSFDHVRQWYGRDGATWLEVQLRPGADPGAVRAGLTRLAEAYPTPVYVDSGEEELRGGEQAATQAAALALALQWMILVAAALALFNTLLLSVLEQRRELAVLRALGATRATVRRMVRREAIGIAAVGCAIGLVLSVPTQYVVTTGLSRAAAVQVSTQPTAVSLLLVPVAFLLAMLAPVIPVRQAARVDPKLALGEV